MAKEFLDLLEAHQLDFTLSFRRLSELAGEEPAHSVKSIAGFPSAFDPWFENWRARCGREDHPTRQQQMLATNPAIIPRNHLIEEAIQAATHEGDFSLFHELIDVERDDVVRKTRSQPEQRTTNTLEILGTMRTRTIR